MNGIKGRIAPNRIKRRFHCSQPHQKITTDTTEFKYYELDANGALKVRKLYLDPFMDLYNLEIISFSIHQLSPYFQHNNRRLKTILCITILNELRKD